ncbi:EmrB/QacA subfamily drug resistance transporter [Chitinophaga dinghuensis]|uniref:EmrB/QacA subfamily drug resistance transporter n=1 Tax=Chitinophaga dinghuensis TaxID=1539050 RepID=A0A327VU10_9BACT|nr:MFS transporter [Chitinophaga dinghuensis]RAJ77540.1 EmrB/QacA subfamily drug resistance transporter [Chitinophaga dinghuensis]
MKPVALHSVPGRWIMITTILASTMAFIDGTALNVVLPALQRGLKASAAELFWVLNGYMLMLASLILIGGALGDKLGRKKIFTLGIAIFITGSAACGLASSAGMLIACRVIQGIGGAFMIPGSLAIISASIQQDERGKAIGTWSAFTTFVTMGGPLLGGALADAGLWRGIFFINVPIGIAVLFFLHKHVAETRDESAVDHRPDYLGAVFIACGLAALTFGFLRMPQAGWNAVSVYGSLLAGIILLIAFIIREATYQHPMMSLHLFKNRIFAGANLLSLFLYAGLGGGMLFLGLNLVQVQGYTQLESGFTFLPFSLLMISLSRWMGAMADKHGPRFFLVTGPLVAGVGLFILSAIQQTGGFREYWTTYFPGILVFGLGMSITVSPLTAAVMGAVSQQQSGTASGVNNAVTRIASVFATAIFGALAVLFFSTAIQHYVYTLPLSPADQEAVVLQARNLGDAAVPAQIPAAYHKVIAANYHAAFIQAYERIMKLCGGLGLLASVMALIFIPKGRLQTDQ